MKAVHRLATRLLALIMLTTATQAGSPAFLIGTYEGGGQECSGKLSVSARSIDWRTPSAHCSGLPYEFYNLGEKNGVTRYLFQLRQSQRQCPYTSVLLVQNGPVAGEATWEAIGYRSDVDRQEGRLDRALACPMVRLH